MLEAVGVIGAGQMGGAMVRRLRTVGRSVVVYDRNAGAMTAAAEAGAELASSAREVADRVEIVFSSLPSVNASIEVADEAVQGSRIKVYVETSTIGRAAVSQIGALVTSRGVGFLDAPVSGGKERVLDGTLTFMVAGAPAHVALARKTLDAVTKSVFVVGEEPGVGQICKLANNAILFANLIMSCEAIIFGAKAGADPAALTDVINASTGRNFGTIHHIPRHILTRTFDFGAPIEAAMKDIDLYLEETKAYGVPSWCMLNPAELLRTAINILGPNQDITRFVTVMESWAQVEIKSGGHE